jgi:hypothetical protein
VLEVRLEALAYDLLRLSLSPLLKLWLDVYLTDRGRVHFDSDRLDRAGCSWLYLYCLKKDEFRVTIFSPRLADIMLPRTFVTMNGSGSHFDVAFDFRDCFNQHAISNLYSRLFDSHRQVEVAGHFSSGCVVVSDRVLMRLVDFSPNRLLRRRKLVDTFVVACGVSL